MRQYGAYLQDAIERERITAAERYSAEDRALLEEMLGKLAHYGQRLHYLAELDCRHVTGWGETVAAYFSRFSSEEIRGYLVPTMVEDRVPDCDQIVLEGYLRFRASEEFFEAPGGGVPAHVYLRYDNAFRALKPKRLKMDLGRLAQDAYSVYRLPLTMQMLSSWKIPEMQQLLVRYADAGRALNGQYSEHMRQELRFTALHGLRYFPCEETEAVIAHFLEDADADVREAAQKTRRVLDKKAKA